MEHRIVPLVKAIRLLARARPAPRRCRCPLARAAGRYAAGDYAAAAPVPACRAAGRDGFLVRAGAASGVYRVAGAYSPAAPPPDIPEDGAAYRVEKGSPLPDGADVVPAARATLVGTNAVRLPPASGEAAVACGSLLAAGTPVVARGERISPGAAALLRASGLAEVEVLDPPVVHVVVIGTEIVAGVVPDLATPWLRDTLGGLGITVTPVATLPDEEDRIRDCIVDTLAGGCVVACGGTGEGLTDLTRAAIRPGGIRFVAESVALSPGSTAAIAFARAGAGLFMPGDHESVAALTHALLRPALARGLGMKIGSWEEAAPLPLVRPWSGPGEVHAFVSAAIREGAIEVMDAPGAGGVLGGARHALMPPGGNERRQAVPVPP